MVKKEIRVGMSGWTYAPWRKIFYPEKLLQKKELEYASRQVTAIEVNGTFYGLQKPDTFRAWYDQAPNDFKFALKAPKYMTHVLRLKDVEESLSTFLASGVLCLKEKLGPILWQFPPHLSYKDSRFEEFAKILPKNSQDAASVSRSYNQRVLKEAFTEAVSDFPIRHAFEVRHPSFENPEFLAMLKHYQIAAVFVDSCKQKPIFKESTSNFVYYRMHGDEAQLKEGYPLTRLKKIAYDLQSWTEKKQDQPAKDVYLFFNNDVKVHAPQDAVKLQSLLKKNQMIKQAA
jgi:uncharacterized protein YecE (DUF72 family)